jgi:hypothetical protein
MPALPNVPNVLRMEMQHTVGTDLDVLTRTFWLYSGSAPSNSGLVSMATALATSWGTVWKPLAGTSITLTNIALVDLTTTSSSEGSHAASIAGTRTGGAMPAGATVLVNYLLARRYRGGKPRSYFPYGVDSDLLNAQQWSSTFTGLVNTALASWDTDVAAAAPSGTTIANQVNVSYYHGFSSVQDPVTLRWRNIPTPRASVLIDNIVSQSCNAKIGSQRKRYVR